MISITKAILYIEFIQILRTYSFYSIKFTFYDQYEVFLPFILHDFIKGSVRMIHDQKKEVFD